jgi:phosphohistidine swiveling domain-containing protein
MKSIFLKEYTRDTCVIIQQAWGLARGSIWETIRRDDSPAIIDHLVDGAIEIWENKESNNKIRDYLDSQHKNEPTKLTKTISSYKKQLKKLNEFWVKGHASDLQELSVAVKLFIDIQSDFIDWYCTSITESMPKKQFEEAKELREKDTLYGSMDKYVRESLKNIYPNLVGFETAILIDELNSPPEKKILQERLKEFIIIDGKALYGIKLKEFLSQNKTLLFVEEKVTEETKLIKGQSAFVGKVIGRVKIIKRIEEVSSLKEGEVLVSPMTIPAFLPAMKKAVGFVTDEGGITCHAAIMARELKKPCIVGTKIATKVLKNGMQIEVDANKGIIKILD